MDFQLTKRLIKDFASLDQPKGRHRTGLFVAEGIKCIESLADKFECEYLFASEGNMPRNIKATNSHILSLGEMRQITRLSTTPPAIAFFKLPEQLSDVPMPSTGEIVLALDRIQDPGNLGTIIRTADWMGIRHIIASPDTVDCFCPKTVQSTMGSLARVNVSYTSLPQYLHSLPKDIVKIGTFLGGENIYTTALPQTAVIVMGNEGSGISPEVEKHIDCKLLIPSYPPGEPTGESLNVATATAIVLSQFISQKFKGISN